MDIQMNARYLTDYPIDGYLYARRSERAAGRRSRSNLRPLLESLGWVLAGATVGSVAVMIGAWGLLQLTEPGSTPRVSTAMTYPAPAPLPQ
jgi:hypothetical protein